MNSERYRPRRAGVSLIEAVISMLLVGSLAVTSLQTTHAILRAQQELNHQRQAYALCEQYLTETLQARYGLSDDDDTETERGKSLQTTPFRSELLYLDEYHQRTESPPQNRDGRTMSGFEKGWAVSIDVGKVSPNQNPAPSAGETGLKKISVTVTDPSGRQVSMHSFRAQLGCNERLPSQSCELIQSVGLSFDMQDAGLSFQAGTKPMDQAPIKNVASASDDN